MSVRPQDQIYETLNGIWWKFLEKYSTFVGSLFKFSYIYIYIYTHIQRLCYSWRRFPHPACHAFLFSQSPGHRFLRSISRCMFSLQSRPGLPLFLLLFGTHSNILLGHRSSGILWTCPYHMSLFMLIVSIMSLFLCTLLLISSFRTCSSLDTPHAVLQKSISKAFSRFSFLLFISHVSEPYVTILSTIVEKIIFFVFMVIL